MRGFITNQDFKVVEKYFPGIRRFYLKSHPKPVTFLELVWRFEVEPRRVLKAPRPGDSRRRQRNV